MNMENKSQTALTSQDDSPGGTSGDLVATLQSDWSLEMDGVDMYQALADRERIPERRKVFEALAAIERKHAEQWAKRLKELGAAVPSSHRGQAHAIRIADTHGGMPQIIRAIE